MSLIQAKSQVTGLERRYCYILGFPVDLNKAELKNEMYNVGCKNVKNIMDYSNINPDCAEMQKDVLECEFESEQDVNLLLKTDLMVRRRNILILPKIRSISIEEMLA